MGWFSKPSEQELYEACRKAETDALKARGDAEVFAPTAPRRKGELEERINAATVGKEDAVKDLSTIISDVGAFTVAMARGEALLKHAGETRDDTANEPSNSKRYEAAAAVFKDAEAEYKKAQEKGSSVEKAHAKGLAALETAQREDEKKSGVKKEAAKLALDTAALSVRLAAEPFVSGADRARFGKLYEAGVTAYSDGKGGFYREAVKAFTEAVTVGEAVLDQAATRRADHEKGLKELAKLEGPVATLLGEMSDPDKTPAKVRLYIKANGGDMVDPSRFESRSHGIAVALKDFDHVKALKTDIPALKDDIDRARAVMGGIDTLKTERARALADLETEVGKVQAKASEVLAIVTSPEYTAGWEAFRKAENREPAVGDLSGITSLVESVTQAAALEIGNTMTVKAIEAEKAAFAETLAFAVEGIEVIRREAKFLVEMQTEVTSGKAEARARADFEALRPKVGETVRQLDLWQWDGTRDAVATLKGLDARVPGKTPWTEGLPELETLATQVDAAHATRKQEIAAELERAGKRQDELKAKAKEAFDALHKDNVLSWTSADGDDILSRLKDEIALLDSFDTTPAEGNAPDYSYLNAAGLNAMADSIDKQLERLKTTKKEDFAALATLKTEIEEVLAKDPFKSIQPTRRGEMKEDFKANVWVPAQKLEVETDANRGSDAATANKSLRDFKAKADAAVTTSEKINQERETAKTKGRTAETNLKVLRQAAKAAAVRSGDDPVDTLKGGYVTVYEDLVAYIRMKDYQDDAERLFPEKVKALVAAFKPLNDATDKGTAALGLHKEAVEAEEAAARAMIDWTQKCDLAAADIDRLRSFLADHPEGDPSEADRLKKSLEQIKKMVKNAENPEIGQPQLVAIQREITDLREHPRNLRAPAMEAIKTATAAWHTGVGKTHANLDKLAAAIKGRLSGNDAYEDKVALIAGVIDRVKNRLDAAAFDDVSTVLRDVKLPRDNRRKVKERGLRDVRALRALWDDPAVKRLMLNPFGVKGVFSDTYKALDAMEFELTRFPV